MNTQNGAQNPVSGVLPISKAIRAELAHRSSIEVGRRIKEARGELSQKQLADALGVHVNTIGKFERGEAVPDVIQIFDIAIATKVTPAWLANGAPYKKNLRESETDVGQQHSAEDLVFVPGYDIKASAGNGSHVNEEQVIGRFAFKQSWLARKGLNPQSLAVVTARGDSMEPTVRDGDILLVDRDVSRISADGIYLIERDNDLYCKRLQRRFDGGVTIMSDNPRYEAQHLPREAAEDLHVAGRVIWIGGER